MYTLLEPYITINNQHREKYQITKQTKKIVVYKEVKKQPIKLDLNTASAQDFMNLGIEKKIAWRIVNFRNVLGGFYSFVQLAEVYDITEQHIALIQKRFDLKSQIFRKININHSTLNEFKKHPYLRSKAKEILNEQQKQSFISIGELVDRNIFTENEFKKVMHYIEI